LTLYALDANAIIHVFKGKGAVGAKMAQISPGRIAIPSVALFEVERGVLGSQNVQRRMAQLNGLIAVCRILPFDERAASIAAQVAEELGRKGIPIGPMDTLIAATALANTATLVTHNTAEFSRVPGLQIEDWY
jgi:tRNA(fMet)-specific endonuclease VapC